MKCGYRESCVVIQDNACGYTESCVVIQNHMWLYRIIYGYTESYVVI